MTNMAHWPPLIQIAGVSSLEESIFCFEAGADGVGFTIGLPTGAHDGLTEEKLAGFRNNIPSNLLVILITYFREIPNILKLYEMILPHGIQFHAGIEDSKLKKLKATLPDSKAIGRITVKGENSIQELNSFDPSLWDAIILDSFDPETKRIGATGRIHDWSISARIKSLSPLPIILAGGLNQHNVAEAIEIVKPDGVDAHTGLETDDGARDFEKISGFIKEAKGAFDTINQIKGAS